MSSSNNVGTVNTTTTGTTYLTGAASGLNSAALIQNALNVKLLPKDRIDAQISTNVNKIAAFQALQTQAGAFKIAADKLKTDTLLGNSFTNRQVSYSTSDGTNAASILTASTSTGVQTGTYKIVVSKLAKAQTVTSATQTSASTALNYTGSFDLNIPGKSPVTINVTPTMTLQNLRNSINAQSSTSGVSADIIQTGNGQYQLILSSTETNKAITISNVTGTDVMQSLGVTDVNGAFLNETQQPQPAELTINNTPVVSDSNTLNNVLTGLSLNLLNAAPGTEVTVNAGNNVDGVKTAIQEFVEAYNTLQQTIAAFKLIGADGTPDEGAYLFGETTNSSLGQQLGQMVGGIYGNAGSQFNGLRSIGITLGSDGLLTLDSTKLTSALQTNYADVQAIFATTSNSVGIADQLSTMVNSYSNVVTGEIAGRISNLQSIDITLQAKSDAIQTSVEEYKLQLINTYAKLEALYKQADTIKKQILAILDIKD